MKRASMKVTMRIALIVLLVCAAPLAALAKPLPDPAAGSAAPAAGSAAPADPAAGSAAPAYPAAGSAAPTAGSAAPTEPPAPDPTVADRILAQPPAPPAPAAMPLCRLAEQPPLPTAGAQPKASQHSPMRQVCEDELAKDDDWWFNLQGRLRRNMHEQAEREITTNNRHVVIAYGAMWILAVLFVVIMWTRQQTLKAEVARLAAELARIEEQDRARAAAKGAAP